jgi:hypothetical protein
MNEGTDVQKDGCTVVRTVRRIGAWLRRPPKRELILAVLADAREPLLGREIAKRAGLGFVGPYPQLLRLEDEGLVASKESPEHFVIGDLRVYRMRVYWLTKRGRRSRVPSSELGLQPETA